MTIKGKWLEDLVATIEKLLLPAGFAVATNEKIFDDSGVQVAEFDIQVEGFLGSTYIKWLIECRDRPSKGAAPTEWIEQLATRKRVNEFNKVTAVSATGFSPGAIKTAQKEQVELRSVEELTEEAILDWFRATKLTVLANNGAIKNVYFILDTENEGVGLERTLTDIRTDSQILIHSVTGESRSILQVWKDVLNLNRDHLFTEILPDQQPVRKPVKIDFPNPNSRFGIEIDGRVREISQILVIADFSINTTEIPVAKISGYTRSPEGNTISQSVTFDEFKIGDEYMKMSIHRTKDDGDIYIAWKKAGE